MKEYFPLFGNYPDLVYLDNAASVQKPQYVLDEVHHFHTHEYANIHRGSYPLALAAEQQRDRARQIVASVIWWETEEIVFTGNATQSSNLLAYSCMYSWIISEGDIIAVGIFDHHANIVPRQHVAKHTWATVIYVWFDPTTWQYDWSVFENVDRSRLKIISLSLVSNVTGQVLSLDFVKKLSKECQTYFIIDASQAIPHLCIDVKNLWADFLYFTGHKCGAMTGIGVLWWKKEHLDRLQPGFVWWWAVEQVTTLWHTYQSSPDKFEPWTPHVAGAVSLRAAFEWIAWLGNSTWSFYDILTTSYTFLAQKENDLVIYACEQFTLLQESWMLTMIGTCSPEDRLWIFSRTLPTWSLHKLWYTLGEQGICIRTWAHCTHPLHHTLGIESSARMSLWLYNDFWDVQKFFRTLRLFLENDKVTHSS